MHHSMIEIYERPHFEDGDGIKMTIQGTYPPKSEAVPETKMQGRRNAIIINFDCSCCGHQSRLLIQQHKGSTLFAWLNSDSPVIID